MTQRWTMGASFDYSIHADPDPDGRWVKWDDHEEIVKRLTQERDQARRIAMLCAKTRAEYQDERDAARAELLCDCGRQKWSRCSVCDRDE